MKFTAPLVLASCLLAATAPTAPVNARSADMELSERDPKISGTTAAFGGATLASIITLGGTALIKAFGTKTTTKRDAEGSQPLLLLSLHPSGLLNLDLGLDKRDADDSQPLLLLSLDTASLLNLGLNKRDPKFPGGENAAKIVAAGLGALATVTGVGIINGKITFRDIQPRDVTRSEDAQPLLLLSLDPSSLLNLDLGLNKRVPERR